MVDQQQISSRGGRLTLSQRELLDRLGWFTQIRWAMGIFILLTMVVSWHIVGVRFYSDGIESMAPAAGVVLLIFVYNAVFTFLVRVMRAKRARNSIAVQVALLQIVCDMLSICALVHYTGGVENVFIILLLVPLVIATELMPQRLAYVVAAVAVFLVNAMVWGEHQGIIPHVHVRLATSSGAHSDLYTNTLYVFTVSIALSITIFAMVFLASAISERLRTREDELEEAYHRLYLADEAKSFFMRKAGHELRAPLAAISSVVGALTQTGELNEQQRDLIGRMQRRTKALLALVSDLRKYSRLRSPEGLVQRETLNLWDVVRNTLELFQQQAANAGVKLGFVLPPDKVWVEGDEELLRELVTNLLANAIQYTPRGGHVDLSLEAESEGMVIKVRDSGIGISEQTRERLFEEFYRAPEARKLFPAGTGLGLAICKRIVDMHGGTIEAVAAPEGGSVFVVRLPLVPK